MPESGSHPRVTSRRPQASRRGTSPGLNIDSRERILNVPPCFKVTHQTSSALSTDRAIRSYELLYTRIVCRVLQLMTKESHDFLRSWLLSLFSTRDLVCTLRRGRFVRDLSIKIVTSGVNLVNAFLHDPMGTCKQAKALCVALRDTWVNKGVRGRGLTYRSFFLPEKFLLEPVHWLRFSYWGRALPKLPQLFFSTAVEEQNQRLSSVPPPLLEGHEGVLQRMYGFLGKLGKVHQSFTAPITSTSSCLETTKKNGGRSSIYSTLYLESGMEGYRFFVDELLSSWPVDTMESVSTVIREYGAKARVVTKSSALRVLRSETYRKPLLRKLSKFRCIGLPLEGKEDNLPLSIPSRWGGKTRLFSADLTAATDLLSKEVIEQVCELFSIPASLATGGTVDGVTMTRGTLMGIPLSWPILSAVHLALCRSIGAPLGSFYLKGDDLIALWPESLIERYCSMLYITGMESNPYKSFTGLDRGFFCEKAYQLSPFESREGRLHCLLRLERSFVSVRSLSYGRRATESSLDRPTVPDFILSLTYLRDQIGRIGHRRARRLQQVAFPWTRLLTHRLGDYAFLPTVLGGVGVIAPSSSYRLNATCSALLERYKECNATVHAAVRSLLIASMAGPCLQRRIAQQLAPWENLLAPCRDYDDTLETEASSVLRYECATRLSLAGVRPSDVFSRTILRIPKKVALLTKDVLSTVRTDPWTWKHAICVGKGIRYSLPPSCQELTDAAGNRYAKEHILNWMGRVAAILGDDDDVNWEVLALLRAHSTFDVL